MLLPEIPDGAGKEIIIVIALQLAEDTILHALVAVTQMFPAPGPLVAVTAFDPCPDVINHPVGTVHV